MRVKDAIGRYGESIAAQHLSDAGLTLLARNWRCAAGEIDIIALDGDVLVFCEVKTRSSTKFGSPAEAVGVAKTDRLRRLAMHWLSAQRDTGDSTFWPALRFDVVAVLRQAHGAPLVEHLRGAF